MGDSAASAAAAAEGNKFTCVMLLAVHGMVSLDDIPSQDLHPLALKDIGTGRRSGSGSSGGSQASVVSFVSPSNLGYSNAVIEVVPTPTRPTVPSYGSHHQFHNHVQRFIKCITLDPHMDADTISQNFNSYDSEFYEFSGKELERSRKASEPRARARALLDNGYARDFSITQQMIAESVDMSRYDIFALMQTTRSALELPWKPHNFCMRNKLYCPADTENQCCLYFPDIDPHLHVRLRTTLVGSNSKKYKYSSLLSNLHLQFDSDRDCVLTIIFDCDSAGDIINKLWQYISLDSFFLNVKKLLNEIFNVAQGFNVEHLMSSTCVVDAACSNFYVTRKKTSIVSFKRDKKSGRVSALIDVHTPSEHPDGFWGYWTNHNPTVAAKQAAAAGTKGKSPESTHRVVNIPRGLEDFVPDCLTCIGSTIKEIQPIFDEVGNVVRVVYTNVYGETEEKSYMPGERPDRPTQSTEAVYGSPDGPGRGDEGRELGDDVPQSISPERSSRVGEAGGGRRRWRRTLKKKCMKRCKTKRLRRRCKTTQKKAVKSRVK